MANNPSAVQRPFAVQRLQTEWRKAQKDPIDCVKFNPDPSDFFLWHYLFYDLSLDSPYAGGAYHGRVVLSANYPYKAPEIYMDTPNGRFQPGHSICTSFTSYHQESWSQAWTVETMLKGLLSFMLGTDNGAGCIKTSDDHKRLLARLSWKANLERDDFPMGLFNETFYDPSNYNIDIGFGSTPKYRADLAEVVKRRTTQ
eukprot:GHVU01038290.1.p1 GENE.GHVU01038290.1~~GHVU01038290.1.p1  ORF type:complete len:199 (-),score=25.40 GHVU01038290.1:587-1183(-)